MLLVGLTLLLLAGSFVFAARLYPEDARLALVASLTLTLACIHGGLSALGWTGTLSTASSIGVALVCALGLGIAGGAVGLARARALLEPLRGGGRDAMAQLGRGDAHAWSVIFVLLLALWTVYVAFLAPCGSWDGLWYHEPMVGWAIQNRGFAPVDLPIELEWVNGYPRACENLMLWIVLFDGRRLIDAIPSLMMLTSLVAFVQLATELGVRPRVAGGLGACLLTIPGSALQLRSTYVDLTVLAGALLALVFLFRPVFRGREMFFAALALGFFANTKSNSLVFASGLAGMMALRALSEMALLRSARLLAPLVGALVLFGVVAAPTFVRNYTAHENPFWPLRVTSRLLSVTFEGPQDFQNMHLGAEDTFREFFGVPTPGQDFHDTRKHAYGYGLTFFGIPALVFALARLARDGLRGDRDFVRASMLVLVGLGIFLASPAIHWARYVLAGVAIALVVIGRWLRDRVSLSAGFVGATMGLNIATLYWAEPAWDVTVAEARELALQTPAERELANTSACLWTSDARRERARRFADDALVVTGFDAAFVANAWNDSMRNRVIMWNPARGPLADGAETLGADILYVRRGSAEDLHARTRGWVELVAANPEFVLLERGPAAEAGAPSAASSPQ